MKFQFDGNQAYQLRAAEGFAACVCRRHIVGGPLDAWCSLMLPAVPRPIRAWRDSGLAEALAQGSSPGSKRHRHPENH
jgi:hypothetical protein